MRVCGSVLCCNVFQPQTLALISIKLEVQRLHPGNDTAVWSCAETTNCSDQYASVMMHWGLRYRNQADRCPLAETERRRNKYAQARKWLQKAHSLMDPVSYLHNICEVSNDKASRQLTD